MEKPTITYALEPDLDGAALIDIFRRSGLAARRPVDDPARMQKMAENADLMVTARAANSRAAAGEGGRLVGVARAITDFAYCCYLSDLAVDRDWQRRGIGRELIRRTHGAAGPGTTLVLLAAPGAVDFYPRAGLVKLETAFAIKRKE